jgi:N-acetylmuramoyl-L-alanine amidase
MARKLIGGLALVLAVFSAAQSAPLPVRRIFDVDYVRLADVDAQFGFKGKWIELGRRVVLGDSSNKVEFEADSREIVVDGLHVFLGEPVIERNGQLYVSKIDYDRRLVPMLRPALLGPPPPNPHIIAIDPGHGGTDHGTENKRLGLMEKTFTIDVAFRLQKILEAQGYKTVLTRTEDVYIPLGRRTEIANRAHADLFVSIHFNSLDPDTKTTGTEVYTFPPKTQHATEWWSQRRKNDSDVELLDEPVNRYDCWSAIFAHAMHGQVLASLKTVDRGEKLKHLGVLRQLNCPGVLVESAFLSNDAEAKRIATPEFRQQVAEAMASAIRAYSGTLDSLRPQESKPVVPPALSSSPPPPLPPAK